MVGGEVTVAIFIDFKRAVNCKFLLQKLVKQYKRGHVTGGYLGKHYRNVKYNGMKYPVLVEEGSKYRTFIIYSIYW